MSILLFETAREFRARIEPELGPREREHHLILGVTYGLLERPIPDTRFLAVGERGRLALASIVSPKHPLILAANESDISGAIIELVAWIARHGPQPPGFIGDVPHAELFSREWARSGASAPRLKMRQRLHALTAVERVASAPGQLRRASPTDVELLAEWQGEFNREAMGESGDPELRDTLAKRVERGEMYLWFDGEPRSMAASARPTARGIAINSVYTPPQWRGHGYATACVAALSQHLLNAGKDFCVLYTDLANPTSNAIYARIGYRAVSDSLFYETGTPAVKA